MPGMHASREWVPPKRNTDDPSAPPLPGMPEAKAPRITPFHPKYHQAGNHEVWGFLAHPDLQEHNPFLKEPDHDYAPSPDDPGFQWRQDFGGWMDREDDESKMAPEAVRKHVQRAFDKASPAIAIDTHPLHQVLDSGRVKTQFETHTSGGMLAPEERRDTEHKMFGYPHDLPAHARPVYGYLTHDPSRHHPAAQTYGNHTLVLHRPRIWHRTSAFLGDSLDDQGGGHSAHPVQDFGASGFPHYADPKQYRLDDIDDEGSISYTEAQYHGGVGLRDVHYAVLHKPDEFTFRHDTTGLHRYHALKDKLNQHRIPWVEMDRGKPTHWEHHLSRLMANTTKGAYMNRDRAQVIGQQGPGRYLIDLGYEDENGHRQAQIADTNTGELHPPMSKDSILARGYWEDPEFEVSVHDVLPLVTPK
jgi:hypothetical protein